MHPPYQQGDLVVGQTGTHSPVIGVLRACYTLDIVPDYAPLTFIILELINGQTRVVQQILRPATAEEQHVYLTALLDR